MAVCKNEVIWSEHSIFCLSSTKVAHKISQILIATMSHGLLQQHATRLGIAFTNHIIKVIMFSIQQPFEYQWCKSMVGPNIDH